jgi:hypothetical protein
MVRLFARWFGVIYILVGILGFVPGINQMMPPEDGVTVAMSYGHLLGIFPVNVVHNIVHLLIGGWGVASAGSFAQARTYAKSIAVFYGLLAVFGFIAPFSSLFGLAPLFSHDIWLHALSAIVAAYFGWGVAATAGDTAA